SPSCAYAAGRATAIHAGRPPAAPASGNAACSSAASRARSRAIWPDSASTSDAPFRSFRMSALSFRTPRLSFRTQWEIPRPKEQSSHFGRDDNRYETAPGAIRVAPRWMPRVPSLLRLGLRRSVDIVPGVRQSHLVRDFLGHVGLVVLGQHVLGHEGVALHAAGGDHRLALAEQ